MYGYLKKYYFCVSYKVSMISKKAKHVEFELAETIFDRTRGNCYESWVKKCSVTNTSPKNGDIKTMFTIYHYWAFNSEFQNSGSNLNINLKRQRESKNYLNLNVKFPFPY